MRRLLRSTPVMLVGAAVLSLGCTTSNRNSTALTELDSLSISGLVPAPNLDINVKLWNFETSQWSAWGGTSFSGGTASAGPDCEGTSWFPFEHRSLLPVASAMLSTSPLADHNTLKVRGTYAGTYDLTTFEADADDCLNQYCSGIDKAQHCASPTSPTLYLYAACGTEQRACCHNGADQCQPGLVCNAEFRCETDEWMSFTNYSQVGDYPDTQLDADWTDEVQGVASDGISWYVTQGHGHNRVFKVPWNVNWQNNFGSYPHTNNNQGCTHWGDPDVFGTRLYIPLEECGGNAKIGLFNASNLSFIGKQTTLRAEAPWVAINPVDGKLYSSTFNPSCIDRYRVSFPAGQFTLAHEKCLPLREYSANQAISMRRIQGGAFSASGKLYLISDSYASSAASWWERSGLLGVQVSPNSATAQFGSHVPVDHYQDCGLGFVDCPEELEGITVQNWSSHGQFHIILLDNGNGDEAFFKHYAISDINNL